MNLFLFISSITILQFFTFSIMPMDAKEKEQAFIIAVKNNDLEQVKTACEAGINIHAKDSADLTALLYAARNGDKTMIKLLLAYGACPNKQLDSQAYYTTPLLNTQHVTIAQFLIAHGALINEPSAHGNTLLMQAALDANPAMVDYLLTLPSINVLAINQLGQTALDLAQKKDFPEFIDKYKHIARLLIRHLRFYTSHGGIARCGIMQLGLPLEIATYLASLVYQAEYQAEYNNKSTT